MDFVGGYKCEQHDENAIAICMQPKCQYQSRIICFDCSIGDHNEHHKDFLRIIDLSKDPYDVKVWPKDNDYKKSILQMNLSTSPNKEQEIDKFFEQFTKSILNEIEKTKETIKKKLMSAPESIDLDSLKQTYSSVYDFQKIKELFVSLASNEVTQVQFSENIKEFVTLINSEEISDKLSKSLQEKALNEMVVMDPTGFKDAEKRLLPIIRELNTLLIDNLCFSGGLQFIPAPSCQDQVEISRDYKQLELQVQYATLINDVDLDKGKYELELQVTGTQAGCCYFGLIPTQHKDATRNNYGQGPYQCIQNGCTNKCQLTSGQNLHESFKIGMIITIFMDFDRDIFEFHDKKSGGNSVYQMTTDFNLKGQKFRFYINNYNNAHQGLFKVLKNQRK